MLGGGGGSLRGGMCLVATFPINSEVTYRTDTSR